MKQNFFLFAFTLLTMISVVSIQCTKESDTYSNDTSGDNSNGNGNGDGNNTNIAPSANFSFTPQQGIIADQTQVKFSNLSTGTISSYIWQFGTGEKTAYTANPTYVFDREGWKTITFHVGGPAGSDQKQVSQIKVHAMDPNLYHYGNFSTQNEAHIQLLRSSGLKIGKLKFRNNYNNVSLKVRLYHPDSWLDGIYTPFASSYWTINASAITTLLYNNAPISIGNDWGIQFEASNGAKSAIRSIHYIATYQNGEFTVLASDLYEG